MKKIGKNVKDIFFLEFSSFLNNILPRPLAGTTATSVWIMMRKAGNIDSHKYVIKLKHNVRRKQLRPFSTTVVNKIEPTTRAGKVAIAPKEALKKFNILFASILMGRSLWRSLSEEEFDLGRRGVPKLSVFMVLLSLFSSNRLEIDIVISSEIKFHFHNNYFLLNDQLMLFKKSSKNIILLNTIFSSFALSFFFLNNFSVCQI